MRSVLLIVASCFFSVFLFSCQASRNQKKDIIQLKTINDTVSYILGSDLAENFQKNGIEINQDVFIRSFEKSLNEKDTLFTLAQRQKIMSRFQKELQVKQQARTIGETQKNKLAGEAFLQGNKKKEGVVELPSGLQYKIISLGTGAKPTADDEVTVNYEGKFLDGKVFDSSYDRKEPATFPLKGVIKGWTEGLQLMNSGSVYEFFIPSDLGYGDNGYGQIPGGTTLIFKVELISVKSKQ